MDSLETVLQRLEQGNIQVQRIKVKENQVFTLTASELLAVCAKNPRHPNADIFRGAVVNSPPDQEVHVDRIDLEALISNRAVVIKQDQSTEFVDGEQKIVTTERKELGDSL